MISNVDSNGQDKDFKKAALVRVPIRLGEDVFIMGEITEQKKERLCEPLFAFAHLMKAYGVTRYKACATNAMRDARNGAEIVDVIRITS